MADHDNVELIRRGFEAFNRADVAALSTLISSDAVQHMPGGPNTFAGDHIGRDAILAMYGEMGAETGGTFGADLQDVKADGADRVVAQYLARGDRHGKSLGTRHTITFAMTNGTATDITDTTVDEAAWNDFWA
jgi:ketosteroid isomerase-like protein